MRPETQSLSVLPRQSGSLSMHGAERRFKGPQSIDVTAAAGIEPEPRLRAAALARVLSVESADGYAVALGLAELDTDTRPIRVILADRMVGGAFASEDGPYRLTAERALVGTPVTPSGDGY